MSVLGKSRLISFIATDQYFADINMPLSNEITELHIHSSGRTWTV